jgi:hypothetical protein
MNQQHRREIGRIVTALEALRDDLDGILTDERDTFDGLSEKAQEGDRGQAMEAAIDTLQAAYDSLDGVVADLGELTAG